MCGNNMTTGKGNHGYIEARLDNVVLVGIPMHRCTACGEVMPELKNIEKIHNSIAEALIKKSASLTGKEVRFLRKEMDKSAKDLAALLSVSPVTVSRWETGAEPVGIVSDKLVRMLYIQTMQERYNVVRGAVVGGIIQAIKPKEKQRPIRIDVLRLARQRQVYAPLH
jgi:putative transcriptional regulator